MNSMLGAICGDILGSTYEFGIEDKKIFLMHEEDHMTDDSVLTCAIAEWMMEYGNISALGKGEQKYLLAKSLFDYTTRYPNKAYGLRYLDWYFDKEIKDYISSKYFYNLNQNIENIRMKDDDFSAICPVTVPQAFIAFFEGEDYESTILNSIVIGGDCDTVASMAGSIAYAYYKEIPDYLLKHCFSRMDEKIKKLCQSFYNEYLAIF